MEALPSSITKPKIKSDEHYKEQLQLAIENYNSEHENEPKIGNIDSIFIPEAFDTKVVYISVDDVLVKRQKEERNKARSQNTPRNVSTTVIHVAADGKAYTISAVGMKKAFSILVAYLLGNRLMEDRQLIFLSDGATDIKKNVREFFYYRPYVLILDWFHLAKKVKEFASMAFYMKKDEKKSTIMAINSYLWVGDVDGAIAYTNSIKNTKVKSTYYRDELCSYLERKRPYICPHALRKEMNLKLSSNFSEKANDMLVANRQKHNGMSWSKHGSAAISTISTLIYNNNLISWIKNKSISLSMDDAGRVMKVA